MPRPQDYGSHIDVIGNVFPPLAPPDPIVPSSRSKTNPNANSSAKEEVTVDSAQHSTQYSAQEPIVEPAPEPAIPVPFSMPPTTAPPPSDTSITARATAPADAGTAPSSKTSLPVAPPSLSPPPAPLPGGYDAPPELLAWLAAPGPDGKPEPPIFVGFGSMVWTVEYLHHDCRPRNSSSMSIA